MSPVPASREACITGLGAVSSVGASVDECWAAWLAGRSGSKRLDFPWIEGHEFHCLVGAPVAPFDLKRWGYTPRDERWLDGVSHQALCATSEALASAGLRVVRHEGKDAAFTVEGVDPTRASVVIATGMGGLASLEAGHAHYLAHVSAAGAGHLRQALVMCIPNAPAAQVALRHGFQGECKAVTTACAGGTMAIGDACRLIWGGHADLVVAGGSEAALSDHDGLGLMAFDAIKCLSTANDDGPRASRPFDRRRDGFVLADGAGVVVLESRAHAEARGAKILARIRSYETTCQALTMVQPDPTGERPARALARALTSAGLSPGDIGAYSAHATSTPAGDVAEARAFRLAFGAKADDVPVHALKGSTGHCIAGAGALEVIAAVLSLRDGVLPPTANLDEVDPECELRHVRGEPAPLARRAILKASFAFGGHDAALVITD